MIATLTPAPPALPELQQEFTKLAETLTSADETITSMVAGRNPVGDGWAPYLGGIAKRFQDARDAFRTAHPSQVELGARLGSDVLKLAEAAGSLGVMARQRATLSQGWTTFLDTAIADATAAAALLGPGAGTPPNEPPVPPTTPPAGPALSAEVAGAVGTAIGLVNQSIARIRTVPVSDRGDASTKDARIAAYELNMQAQQALEQHFDGDAAVASQLRRADAHLEDANWQLAKKPSPDGRFNGVDIPGALRDSQAAVDLLARLVNPGGIAVDPTEAVSVAQPSDAALHRIPFAAR